MSLKSKKSDSAPSTKTRERLQRMRWTRSGLYSWVKSKRLPRARAFIKIRRELSILGDDLVQQHGGEKITPDALILVDSIVEALGVQKLLGLYIRKYGVIDEQSAKAGRLELNPILAKNWISYGNTVRQALLALKEITAAREAEEVLSPLDIAELIDAENAEKAAKIRGQKYVENETFGPSAPGAGGPGGSTSGGTIEGAV